MALIDLRSDTLSKPTPDMLQSMAAATLGDDSRDGDPTVRELEAEAAQLLGKDAALLTVSGTMSNTVALRTHAEPGGAAVVEESAHVYGMEHGSIASACGLLAMPIRGHRGAPDLDAVRWAIRRARTLFPASGLVCLENTHNAAGGAVLTPAQIDGVAEAAHQGGFAVHLDGARLFNAAVALGVDARELTRSVDSVSVCLSKGLSAPIGSLLAGPKAFIERANRVRRAFGGAMRQAGILAAPGLVALRTMIPRLAEDHDNARRFARAVAGVPGLSVDLSAVQSNIVHVDVGGLGIEAAAFAAHLREWGVRGLPGMGSSMRFVTYRGITRADVEEAARVAAALVEARPWAARGSVERG
ncbi:MAG TPA: GntG family PLP-dependent aldolase [Vicinamibacterales bacterium]|nr:GntG family PLP-dependent aldolase [Vicinamibacterales bacterium]HPW20078.1 GntG family PLP-dependent aldolase [Vicinamibacterales bacterium]